MTQIQNRIDENQIDVLKEIIESFCRINSSGSVPLYKVCRYAVQKKGIPIESMAELIKELKQHDDVVTFFPI